MRAIGAVHTRQGMSAMIRVISIKKNKAYVTDHEELKKVFPPEGLIYASKILEKFEVDSLIEFQAIVPHSSSSSDQLVLDRNSPCNAAGYEVVAMSPSLLIEGESINLENIDYDKVRPHSEFYVLIDQFLYGPFKKLEDYIQPTKEVYRIDVDRNALYPVGNKLYLLSKPAGITKFDSMNQVQLGDWLKEQLRSSGISVDLSIIRQSIANLGCSALDHVRRKRVLKCLDQLSLNHSELQTLSDAVPFLKNSYEKALKDVYNEIVVPYLEQVKEIESAIGSLQTLKLNTESALESKLVDLRSTTDELNSIRLEKTRLIEDIKIHALVHQKTNDHLTPISTYDLQSYLSSGEFYTSIDDFINAFKQTIVIGKEDLGKAGHKMILQLRDFRCILSWAIEPILQMARLANNANIFIQQVEPDWLKYDNLYNNGLRQAWESAVGNPDTIHFLVLQDINIASIECYGRPVNDVISGIRKSLPGLTGVFPLNLWLFGIPLQLNPDQEFGLPLIKESFKNWGAIPLLEADWGFVCESSDLVMKPSMLIDHDHLATCSLDDYFKA